MRYSIIIPAHHRPEALGRLLASIAREGEDLPPESFEVIVVIDGEDEAVRKEVQSRLGHLPLTILQNHKPVGAAAARNQGAASAQGAILVFLDDDVELALGWAKVLLACVGHIDLLTGDVYFGNPDRLGAYPERVVRSVGGQWPLSAHMLVRRGLFVESGGFDETFAALHNEDSEFTMRILAHGEKWEHLSALAVHHEVCWWPSPGAVLRSARRTATIPMLMRYYPKVVGRLPLDLKGPVLFPRELLLLLFFPITVWPLLVRFCWRNRYQFWRALPFFFAKWPCTVFLRRCHLWRSAWKNRVFVV